MALKTDLTRVNTSTPSKGQRTVKHTVPGPLGFSVGIGPVSNRLNSFSKREIMLAILMHFPRPLDDRILQGLDLLRPKPELIWCFRGVYN